MGLSGLGVGNVRGHVEENHNLELDSNSIKLYRLKRCMTYAVTIVASIRPEPSHSFSPDAIIDLGYHPNLPSSQSMAVHLLPLPLPLESLAHNGRPRYILLHHRRHYRHPQ